MLLFIFFSFFFLVYSILMISIECVNIVTLLYSKKIHLHFFERFFVRFTFCPFSAYLLVFILLFFSLISCLYYIRLVKIIYFSFQLKYATVNTIPFAPSLIISLFSFINLFFLVYPSAFALIIA